MRAFTPRTPLGGALLVVLVGLPVHGQALFGGGGGTNQSTSPPALAGDAWTPANASTCGSWAFTYIQSASVFGGSPTNSCGIASVATAKTWVPGYSFWGQAVAVDSESFCAVQNQSGHTGFFMVTGDYTAVDCVGYVEASVNFFISTSMSLESTSGASAQGTFNGSAGSNCSGSDVNYMSQNPPISVSSAGTTTSSYEIDVSVGGVGTTVSLPGVGSGMTGSQGQGLMQVGKWRCNDFWIQVVPSVIVHAMADGGWIGLDWARGCASATGVSTAAPFSVWDGPGNCPGDVPAGPDLPKSDDEQ